jgi:hypothetical protein
MIPALLLILAAVLYRVFSGLMIQSGAGWLSNFAPFAAIALCSAAFLPRHFKFTVPLLALFLSDSILNFYYGQPLLTPFIAGRYFVLALICVLGWALEGRASLRRLLPASLAGSTLFYIVTNTFSWMSDAGYVKSAAGWVQALTVGLPQYSATPTWMFFRNSLLSDLVFTTAFVLCLRWVRQRQEAHPRAPLPHPA